MPEQAIILATLRGLHLMALVSCFGTLVSLALVAPAGLREAPGEAAAMRHRLLRLALWSDTLALLLGMLWALLETAEIAGAASLGAALGAVGTVAIDTQFGHAMVARLAMLSIALPLMTERHPSAAVSPPARVSPSARGWRLTAALVLSGGALALQGEMAHAGALGGAPGATLLAAEALHLIAAGAWLGGLLPLLLLVRGLPRPAAASACLAFSPVGLAAVLAIACTAAVQAWALVGSLAGLIGTDYGRIASLKLAIFLLLLCLAATNRFLLTDRLRDPARRFGKRAILGSIGTEATLGAVVIVVAAFLASSTPATHETPIWPFARQPDLTLLADPTVRILLLRILVPSMAAAILVMGGLVWRPLLWPALAGLLVCVVLAWPDLEPLLTAEAYPTSFVTSPTEFAAGSIVRGAALFAANCAACHGASARGDGPLAKSLPIPPADLTAPHFWGHSEGDLYWFITHGIEARPGVPVMPPFADTLSSGKVWALIDFLKANNAGASMRSTGRWDQPIPLPQFDAVCADGSAIDRDDLANRVVHVIAAAHTVTPPPAPPGVAVATIVLAADRAVKPAGSACVAVEPEVWDAFALLLGEPPAALAGTQVLADRNGWLRLRWQPGEAPDWNDSHVLAAAIRDIAAHPLAVATGGGHAHHH